MSYKNSVKLLTTNFSLVWKQLCYMLIICLAFVGISYGFAVPTINLLKETGVIDDFSTIFETIYTAPKDVIGALSDAFLNFTNVITKNFGKIWFSVLSTTILARLCYQIFKNISFYNLASVMHYQLTCFTSVGYTRNLISTLKQSIKYAFVRLIYTLPFTFLKLATIYVYFSVATTSFIIFVGLFVVSLTLILLSAIEMSFFTGLTGYSLEHNGSGSNFKAFFKGNTYVLKKFHRVFSNAIIATITIIVVNIFFGVFTLGVGLLITLPATMLFKAIFELCSYFGVKGERYYLSSTIIATPLKSAENEDVNNIK